MFHLNFRIGVRFMRTIRAYTYGIAVISATILFTSLFIAPEASAQRRGGGGERNRGARVTQFPRAYSPVIVGGHRYFYRDGFFYRGGGRGYMMIPAPIGARIRGLPFGFLSFSIGALPYYYYGGVYYQYLPDQSCYVVVQKPSGAPQSTASDNEDKAALTDGTTLSGVFEGASGDSIQFRVNGQSRSIPITKITSINFAPSTFDTTAHK